MADAVGVTGAIADGIVHPVAVCVWASTEWVVLALVMKTPLKKRDYLYYS